MLKALSLFGYIRIAIMSIVVIGLFGACAHDDSIPPISNLDFQYVFDYQGVIYGVDKDFNDSVSLSSDSYDLRFEPDRESFPFSPDFTQAVALHETPEFSNLVIVNLDGSESQELTNAYLRDYQPSWSPDGSNLVFLRREEVAVNNLNSIFIINRDGSEIQEISSEGYHWAPRFIDSETILYKRFSEIDEEFQFYTFNILTQERSIVQGFDGLNVQWHTVSNDNSQIVYYQMKSLSEWELYLTDIEGSQHDLLAVLPKPYGFESWSPNNRELLLVSPRREIGTNLWRLRVDSPSQSLEDLTTELDDEALIRSASWSPNGEQIFFLSNVSLRTDLYRSMSGGLINLTESRLENGIEGLMLRFFWID